MVSRKNYKILIIILLIIIIMSSCQKSPTQILKSKTEDVISNNNDIEYNNYYKNYETVKIKKEYIGVKTNLDIDLEVKTYANRMFGIYYTSPIHINVSECFNFFFKGVNKENIIHLYDEEFYKKKYKLENQNYKENILCYYDTSSGKTASYDINNQYSLFTYLINKKEKFIPERPGNLLRREQNFIISDIELLKKAEKISYDFFSFVFKEDFTNNFTKSFSGLKSTKLIDNDTKPMEVYLVTFNRLIDGFPILFDQKREKLGYYNEPSIDELEVWVNNNRILYAAGSIRNISLKEKKQIISLQKALNILEVYFETGEEQGDFQITRFELMYYPTFLDDKEMTNVYSKQVGAAYVKYIPVWVIASGERVLDNTSTHKEYVMIIDAITGEIIRRRKG